MDKPVKIVMAPAWDLFKICQYIEKVHQVNADEFQMWFCDKNYVHNGCYSYICIKEDLIDKRTEPEIKKFLQLLLDEFGEEEMHVWVSW